MQGGQIVGDWTFFTRKGFVALLIFLFLTPITYFSVVNPPHWGLCLQQLPDITH